MKIQLSTFSRRSILRFLIFHLFFVTIVHSEKNRCIPSFCGNNSLPIKYPFKLPGQQLQNCQYIDLKCSNDNIVTLDIPYAGELYVEGIYYETHTIGVYDPNNCLPQRLLELNLMETLLTVVEYENYTFYSCPLDVPQSRFKIIECMSNSTNATVATSFLPQESMEILYKCQKMFTSSIPVSWLGQLDHWGTDRYLQLEWNLSCKYCQDGSRSKLSKIIAIILSIPGIIIVATLCCIGSCMQLVKMVRNKYEHFGTTAPGGGAPPQATMFPIIVPPHAATSYTGAPPQSSGGDVPMGLDDSKIKSYTELVVVNEGQSIGGSESNACPICLEVYQPKEMVRCIVVCKHCFHANCIEQWLRKNGSCPVCRTSALSDLEQVRD